VGVSVLHWSYFGIFVEILCSTLAMLWYIYGVRVSRYFVMWLCIIFMFQMCCFVRSDFAISTFTLCFTSIVFSLLIFLLVRFLLILFCTGVIYSECAFCTVPSKWYFIIQLCCFVTPDYARVLAIYLNLNRSRRTEFWGKKIFLPSFGLVYGV
jgi:hypothetical protein